jgi:hypothetical protein
MRQYLLEKFLSDLTATAGIPEDVLWAPLRYTSTNESGDTAIQDKLWLSTEWELFQNGNASISDTAANQTRLEYYTNNSSLEKRRFDDVLGGYWEANEDFFWWGSRYRPNRNGDYSFYFSSASVAEGCVPAFCIK